MIYAFIVALVVMLYGTVRLNLAEVGNEPLDGIICTVLGLGCSVAFFVGLAL